MLFQKLAKASNSNAPSPLSSGRRNSGQKRPTLEIFAQFRQSEDLNE